MSHFAHRLHSVLRVLAIATLAAPFALVAQTDYSELFERASPSVFTLKTFDSVGFMRGQASGFIISEDGLLVTCFHVIERGGIIQVQASDGRRKLLGVPTQTR